MLKFVSCGLMCWSIAVLVVGGCGGGCGGGRGGVWCGGWAFCGCVLSCSSMGGEVGILIFLAALAWLDLVVDAVQSLSAMR